MPVYIPGRIRYLARRVGRDSAMKNFIHHWLFSLWRFLRTPGVGSETGYPRSARRADLTHRSMPSKRLPRSDHGSRHPVRPSQARILTRTAPERDPVSQTADEARDRTANSHRYAGLPRRRKPQSCQFSPVGTESEALIFVEPSSSASEQNPRHISR
jgi:hypothetical protein